jgi:hypothetical protein
VPFDAQHSMHAVEEVLLVVDGQNRDAHEVPT